MFDDASIRHTTLELGTASLVGYPDTRGRLRVPPSHFVTHGVFVGMTGSGKTGAVTVLAEEALRTKVPVLVLDVKGDLPNLLLAFRGRAPPLPRRDPTSPSGSRRRTGARRR